MSGERDAWGRLDWDGEERRIHVFVDWDLLDAEEARDLSRWLLQAADALEAETAAGGPGFYADNFTTGTQPKDDPPSGGSWKREP